MREQQLDTYVSPRRKVQMLFNQLGNAYNQIGYTGIWSQNLQAPA